VSLALPSSIFSHPSVLALAASLRVQPASVVGGLLYLLAVEGTGGVLSATVDQAIGLPGFAAAAADHGLLLQSESTCAVGPTLRALSAAAADQITREREAMRRAACRSNAKPATADPPDPGRMNLRLCPDKSGQVRTSPDKSAHSPSHSPCLEAQAAQIPKDKSQAQRSEIARDGFAPLAPLGRAEVLNEAQRQAGARKALLAICVEGRALSPAQVDELVSLPHVTPSLIVGLVERAATVKRIKTTRIAWLYTAIRDHFTPNDPEDRAARVRALGAAIAATAARSSP
jgi:hypothetical protein